MKGLLRGVIAGLIWLGVLFVSDGVASYWLFQRSTKRIRTDHATYELLVGSVADFVSRAAVGYLFLGVLAGVTLFFTLRIWFPVDPKRTRWWWLSAATMACIVTAFVYLRQAVLFPALHPWFPVAWVDRVAPMMVSWIGVGVLVGWLNLIRRRWRHPPKEGGGRLLYRTFALTVWLMVCALLLRHPRPDHAQDNAATNVVLIGVDSLRPDHLASNDYASDTAPNIDKLLAESVVFDSTWTPLARTYPAWISMMSGTLPTTNGMRDNLPEPDKLVPSVSLLPQVLRAAGWTTSFATDDSRFSYMVPEIGFDRIVQPPPHLQNFAVSMNEPMFRAFAALMHNPLGFKILPTVAYNQATAKSYRPLLFVNRSVDLLAETSRDGRPFFYAVHSCVLHAPGERPYPWHQMWGQRGYEGGNRFRYSRSGTTLMDPEVAADEAAEKIAAQDLRIYDSGIDMADRLVGEIVGELKRSGLWDNSIVVLFSDHGEEHWSPDLPYEFNGPNHGFQPYGDGQHRVVWGIRFPDGQYAGTRVSDPVRLIDMAPTFADILGLPWPGATDGRSAMPLVRGETEAGPREVYIETGVSEPRYWNTGHVRYPFKRLSAKYRVDATTGRVQIKPKFRPHLIAAKDRVLQVGRWKLVWRPLKGGETVELFDRSTDPLNRHDLASTHPEIVADLYARIAPILSGDGIEPRPTPVPSAETIGMIEP